MSSIHESFSLFAVQHPSYPSETYGVLKREDIRRCLIALGVTPSSEDLPSIIESLDPESEGFVTFEPFLEVAGLYLNEQGGSGEDDEDALSSPPTDDLSEDDIPARGKGKKRTSTGKTVKKSKAKGKSSAVVTSQDEINAAFKLFTKGGTGPITIQHLRRVARELREEISDDMLRDMILEANGEGEVEGKGRDGWKKGVAIEDFENVMKRAGVFG